MNRMGIKMIVAGSAIAIAVVVLAVSGVRDGWVYFLPVDEFIEQPNLADQRVRLHGKVGESDLVIDAAAFTADFNLHGETQQIRVSFSGVIPDLFKAGNDVVVEGALDETNVFQADTLMTKCASKYESEGQAPHGDPRESGADE